MELTDEEKAALIAALEAEDRGVVGLSHQAMIRLDAIGLIVYHQSTRRGCLATAGQIVAALLKENAELRRDLERAEDAEAWSRLQAPHPRLDRVAGDVGRFDDQAVAPEREKPRSRQGLRG